MTRILWLTENFFPRKGGMAQSCDRIVYQLRQVGLWIDVVHLFQQGKMHKEMAYQGTNLHFPLQTDETETQIDEAHALNILWLQIQQNKPTHVVAFGGTVTMIAAEVFATWWEVPLVVLLRGNDWDTGVFSVRKRDILDRTLSKANIIACVSSDKVWRVQKMYAHTQVVYTPNGIDIENWVLLPSDKQKALQFREQNNSPQRKIIGLFGQLKAKKGGIFFLDALCKAQVISQVHLLITGEISEAMQTKLKKIPDLSLSHLPFMDRYSLLPYYAACDVVAIPSFYDGMPNVLLEAGALGITCLGSNVGGMADILEHDQNSWVFEAGDLDSCSNVLQQMLAASSQTFLEYGQALQQKIKSQFTEEKERERYIKIFRKDNN